MPDENELSPEHGNPGGMNGPDPRVLLDRSSLVASRDAVRESVERMAAEVNAYYGERPILLLVVMTGAVMPAAWLAARLRMPLRMDFVHATRYDGSTEGGEIRFRVAPRIELARQDVLIVEDIYDAGVTLDSIERLCREQGAASVESAVLVHKQHGRDTVGRVPRFVGLEVDDRYIFGCGMDAYEYWRQLDEIRALDPDATEAAR